MNISTYELRILNTFHREYFTLDNLSKFRKPDLEDFIKQELCEKKKRRIRIILALYFFRFWCSAYIIHKPSDEFVRFAFKEYKLKP
jgi:hypothetical protein